jgi:uncharacterized membrane protein
MFTVMDEYTTALGPLATLQGTRPTAATSSQAGIAASISSSSSGNGGGGGGCQLLETAAN